jgi:hypothetical protein
MYTQESWKQYLVIKCQNLNRCDKKSDRDDSPVPSAKRPKLSPLKHPYSSFSTEIEDDTSHERNLTLLKKEAAQVKPRMDVLKDLMKRTYGRRRKLILDGYDSVQHVCSEYSPLKKAFIVSICHIKSMSMYTGVLVQFL